MKNAFKCTLEELTIKCIFKRLVGVHTPSSYIHMIQGMEISLCRAFRAMRLLYYNLSTAKICK